jgi:hypothetical protein
MNSDAADFLSPDRRAPEGTIVRAKSTSAIGLRSSAPKHGRGFEQAERGFMLGP